MKAPTVVLVTWEDACLRMGAEPMSNAANAGQLSTRYTVGWLVARTRQKIVLAVTFDPPDKPGEETHADDLYTIPAQWIRRVQVLRKGGEKL